MSTRFKRRFRISSLPLPLLLLGISMTSCSREAQKLSAPRQAADLATQYLECSARADMSCTSRLFHYPGDETDEEQRADMNGVVHSLSIITRHFGASGPAEPANDPVVYVEVAAGSADLAYWQAHPESLRATYRTKFAKFGEGFIAVEMCHVSEKWEIRSVHYGLPVANPRSAGRIMQVFNELKRSEPAEMPAVTK